MIFYFSEYFFLFLRQPINSEIKNKAAKKEYEKY